MDVRIVVHGIHVAQLVRLDEIDFPFVRSHLRMLIRLLPLVEGERSSSNTFLALLAQPIGHWRAKGAIFVEDNVTESDFRLALFQLVQDLLVSDLGETDAGLLAVLGRPLVNLGIANVLGYLCILRVEDDVVVGTVVSVRVLIVGVNLHTDVAEFVQETGALETYTVVSEVCVKSSEDVFSPHTLEGHVEFLVQFSVVVSTPTRINVCKEACTESGLDTHSIAPREFLTIGNVVMPVIVGYLHGVEVTLAVSVELFLPPLDVVGHLLRFWVVLVVAGLKHIAVVVRKLLVGFTTPSTGELLCHLLVMLNLRGITGTNLLQAFLLPFDAVTHFAKTVSDRYVRIGFRNTVHLGHVDARAIDVVAFAGAKELQVELVKVRCTAVIDLGEKHLLSVLGLLLNGVEHLLHERPEGGIDFLGCRVGEAGESIRCLAVLLVGQDLLLLVIGKVVVPVFHPYLIEAVAKFPPLPRLLVAYATDEEVVTFAVGGYLAVHPLGKETCGHLPVAAPVIALLDAAPSVVGLTDGTGQFGECLLHLRTHALDMACSDEAVSDAAVTGKVVIQSVPPLVSEGTGSSGLGEVDNDLVAFIVGIGTAAAACTECKTQFSVEGDGSRGHAQQFCQIHKGIIGVVQCGLPVFIVSPVAELHATESEDLVFFFSDILTVPVVLTLAGSSVSVEVHELAALLGHFLQLRLVFRAVLLHVGTGILGGLEAALEQFGAEPEALVFGPYAVGTLAAFVVPRDIEFVSLAHVLSLGFTRSLESSIVLGVQFLVVGINGRDSLLLGAIDGIEFIVLAGGRIHSDNLERGRVGPLLDFLHGFRQKVFIIGIRILLTSELHSSILTVKLCGLIGRITTALGLPVVHAVLAGPHLGVTDTLNLECARRMVEVFHAHLELDKIRSLLESIFYRTGNIISVVAGLDGVVPSHVIALDNRELDTTVHVGVIAGALEQAISDIDGIQGIEVS